jgi:hypothetical protein
MVRQPLMAVLLATDGYGNAQVVEDWPSAFSQDLAWMLRERDLQWLASQLPGWAAKCASPDGSADDTTVALIVSAAASVLRASATGTKGPGDGSEETTIPASPRAVTVPADPPAGSDLMEPVTMRQLARRRAPEPVILERIVARPASHGPDTTELVSQEPDTTELVIHEPATTDIPKLSQGQVSEESRADADGTGGL